MLSDRRPEWQALAKAPRRSLRDLYRNDPRRFEDFSIALPGLLMDYSRQAVDRATMDLLLNLARACDLETWRDRMFSGEAINTSEGRAVLHTALRRPETDAVFVNGGDVMPAIHDTLSRMRVFADSVHSGQWTGHTGKKIASIVNIGIGGSDLGPRMVVDALRPFRHPGLDVHFVSNVDAADLLNALQGCNPETTLFLIASKTFTTAETMANAHAARQWLADGLGSDSAVQKHFAALSTNRKAVESFGIHPDNMFPFEDWVGGRYSVWSSIGLSVALATGFDHFRALLDGAHAMDRHFVTAPLDRNAPVLMGLLGVWNRNFQEMGAQAVLPYDRNMHLFSAWLQQVAMESNGKRVSRDNESLTYNTSPVVFGTSGTDCQHSYFQMIHQGTSTVPCDFIAAIAPHHSCVSHHRMLLANLIAQADALMEGRPLEKSGNDPQRTFPGNRPSTILLIDRTDPFHLGQIMALYEHKVFVEGILWNINSFDQFGVELGKILANQVLEKLAHLSGSFPGILGYIRARYSG
jgi:glucose-6-phosphate isomerase